MHVRVVLELNRDHNGLMHIATVIFSSLSPEYSSFLSPTLLFEPLEVVNTRFQSLKSQITEEFSPRMEKSEKNVDAEELHFTSEESRAREAGIEPAFLAKVEVLNRAIKEIGLGRYQYELFITAGELESLSFCSRIRC